MEEFINLISKHGMIGPNFAGVPETFLESVYFDFHGHPGYPQRWIVPPSRGDIGRSIWIVNNTEESKIDLEFQLVSLRLTTDDFRLFFRPYFRDENWLQAMFEPMIIRISYLNEVYT